MPKLVKLASMRQEHFDQLRDSCLIESQESLGARCASASTAEMGALLQQSAALGQAAHFRALLLHVLARDDAAEALMQTNKRGESVLHLAADKGHLGVLQEIRTRDCM